MATLVLTAVGTAIGGPIGASIGAVIGQQIDAAIFAPKARQGPRLSDLKIQTSSYGDAIPQIFGTLRVAGTVVWATDLIERRQKRSAGKGQPKVVEYSYSASLAVALSSRRIRRVRRIWADGRLLRDGNDVFAEQVRMRVHDGSADQPVDLLIASSLGLARASAFRGLAYVMLEELDLAAFGNRIPQMSFEVEADDGSVSVALVAGVLTKQTVMADPALMLAGFAASGARVRDALAPLAELAQLGLRRDAAKWALASAEAPQAGPTDPVVARIGPAVPLRAVEDRRMSLARVADAVSLRHYDPARDYQTSVQSAPVAGGGARAAMLELPGAMTAEHARSAAQRMALVAGDRRRTVTVRAGLGALALPIGAVLTLALTDEAAQRWRIMERVVADAGVRLTLVQHAALVSVGALAGDGGAAQVPGDLPGGTTLFAVFDAPGDGETAGNVPVRLVAAAGSDARWRGADLWWVGDPLAEPESLGRISSALALGVLAQPLAPAATWLVDRSAEVFVILANAGMELTSISHARMLAGGNRAMVGGEVIQFEQAVPLGGGQWRLTGLLRGRGGTDDVSGPHVLGTNFVLLDDFAVLPLPDSFALRVMATDAVIERQERGQIAMQQHGVPAGNRAVRPLSPVHGRAIWIAGGGWRIAWVQRSRAGARWPDGVGVPSGETAQRWRVQWRDTANILVEREVEEPQLELLAGAFDPATDATITQIGDFGVSPPLTVTLA